MATEEDISTLRAFEQELVGHERAVEPTLMQEGHLTYYDIPELLKDTDKNVLLIAEWGEVPVGCGMGQIQENDACYNESNYGYIGLMFVDKQYRKKNIGGQIVNHLLEWFKTKGLKEVHLKMYATNGNAKFAYEKYGFRPYIEELRLEL